MDTQFRARLNQHETEYVLKVISIFRDKDDSTVQILVRQIDALLLVPDKAAKDKRPKLILLSQGKRYALEEANGVLPTPRPGEEAMLVYIDGNVYLLHEDRVDWGE